MGRAWGGWEVQKDLEFTILDLLCSLRGVPEGALPGGGPPARDLPFWPVQAMQRMASATPGGLQGPLPLGLQQQQQQWQQLLIQQQQQQQQQQLMMQQQVCYYFVDIFQYRLSH